MKKEKNVTVALLRFVIVVFVLNISAFIFSNICFYFSNIIKVKSGLFDHTCLRTGSEIFRGNH